MRLRRTPARALGALAASLLALSGCAGLGPVGPMRLSAVRFDDLPGWSADHPAAALPAILASCDRFAHGAANAALGGFGEAAARGGQAGQWSGTCDAVRRAPAGDDAAVRAVLEANLQPWRIAAGERSRALFTGYFEPEVAGSRTRGAADQTPLYARPRDLVQVDPGTLPDGVTGARREGATLVPYYDRAQIEHGALSGRRLEIAWLADPVDAFFLQIQGSGRIRLPDGRIMRVGYAGKNGWPYVAIGRVLAGRAGRPGEISMQTIRAWLDAHPAEAPALMDANPSYVFFREVVGLHGDEGPLGAFGVALTPGRSLAVDRACVPLGAPMWVATTDPVDGGDFDRLMVAQDIGDGISGPLRADIFYGWGADAEARAGRANQDGALYVLLPKG